MLAFLPSYLVSIQTWHCNAYVKNLLSQVCVNNSYHLFSALSINADHPLAGQKKELGRNSNNQGKEREMKGRAD